MADDLKCKFVLETERAVKRYIEKGIRKRMCIYMCN